ncbi:hypothetical protein EMIT053CA3_30109 [Pseudomonas donghuensis]
MGMAKALVEDVAHAMVVESGPDGAQVDLASSTLRSPAVSTRVRIRHGKRWGIFAPDGQTLS